MIIGNVPSDQRRNPDWPKISKLIHNYNLNLPQTQQKERKNELARLNVKKLFFRPNSYTELISWCISHENGPSECHLNDHCGHDNWQCAIRSMKKYRLAKDIEAHP